jgi:cysteinyl-tRNA synthetase
MRISNDSEAVQQFQTAMDDDFNTPGAIAVLFDLAKELRRAGNLIVHEGNADRTADDLRNDWQTLVVLAEVLGLQASFEAESSADGLDDAAIEAFIQQRLDAKKAKNFADADRIRDELKAQGIVLIDKPGGTEWHRE